MTRALVLAGVLAGACCAALPAGAALSGYWQSVTEIEAILKESMVGDALKQQPVESVVQIAPGVWEVRSAGCALRATVHPGPASGPGLAPFRLEIGQAACR